MSATPSRISLIERTLSSVSSRSVGTAKSVHVGSSVMCWILALLPWLAKYLRSWPEPSVSVPLQKLGRRAVFFSVRKHGELLTLVLVVVLSVGELFVEQARHMKPVFLVHGHVTQVEEAMYICTQRETVRHLIRPVVREGANVRCFQHGNHALASNCTAFFVCVQNA